MSESQQTKEKVQDYSTLLQSIRPLYLRCCFGSKVIAALSVWVLTAEIKTCHRTFAVQLLLYLIYLNVAMPG